MLRRNMWESGCHYLCDTFIIMKVRSEYLLTIYLNVETTNVTRQITPSWACKRVLHIMHVFTHFKFYRDFSVTPTVIESIDAEHSIWQTFGLFMLTPLKRPCLYVSCRPVQSTENFNSNSNCHNSKQASLTLIFYWVIRNDKILSLMTIAH